MRAHQVSGATTEALTGPVSGSHALPLERRRGRWICQSRGIRRSPCCVRRHCCEVVFPHQGRTLLEQRRLWPSRSIGFWPPLFSVSYFPGPAVKSP